MEIVSDEADALPIVLSPPNLQSAKLSVPVRRFDTTVEATPVVRARAADGRLLVEKVAKFTAGEERTKVVFDLPLELRNSLSQIDVQSHETAASVVLLDGRWQRRSVGLVSSRPRDSGHALLSEVFFIKRALSPFSEIFRQIAKLTAAGCSVIVLPDREKVETGDQANLDAWIRRGGIVLRFAGHSWQPVKTTTLRRYRSAAAGGLLAARCCGANRQNSRLFPNRARFTGSKFQKDVTITRQVLAQPSLDLTAKSWARLTDGTPLVSAEQRGEGWLVLVHTTASTEWSNLSLSGLFVEMLRRVVWLSRRVDSSGEKTQPLPPYELLDGFGALTPPYGSATAIDLQRLDELSVGPKSPPGYYGSSEVRHAVNLAPFLGNLAPLADLPDGVGRRGYSVAPEQDLGPWFLMAALLLLLLDTVATLTYRGLLPNIWTLRRRGAALPIIAVVLEYPRS